MWDTTRPTLLVTGFGPFGPVADNPTARLIAHMDAEGEAFCPDARLVTAVLPTSYRRAAETFETLLTEHRPLGVLSFGVATKADKIRLERFAQNLDDADLPDIDGKQLQGRPPPRSTGCWPGCSKPTFRPGFETTRATLCATTFTTTRCTA